MKNKKWYGHKQIEQIMADRAAALEDKRIKEEKETRINNIKYYGKKYINNLKIYLNDLDKAVYDIREGQIESLDYLKEEATNFSLDLWNDLFKAEQLINKNEVEEAYKIMDSLKEKEDNYSFTHFDIQNREEKITNEILHNEELAEVEKEELELMLGDVIVELYNLEHELKNLSWFLKKGK